MRWPVDAISLLSRAGRLDTAKTYELMRNLRQLANNFMRELWEASVERKRESGSVALREATREEWMKQKRRLGAIGRDKKGKLMPQWESVKRLPLHRIRHQLTRWTRVSFRTVLRGGQQTLNGYVTRARDVAKRPVHDDDDGAVAETHKQRRANPPEQPQRQPTLQDALKRAAAATASSAVASVDGSTATAATAPQPTGAKRGPDMQTEASHRPTASARITVSSPRPAPLAAASTRRKRRHSGGAAQDQSSGSATTQPKRRRAPAAPATQSIERFLTPVATAPRPLAPPQDHPAPLPPPEPPPSSPENPHSSSAPHDPTITLHLRLPDGRPILFGFWCWWALANLARCGRVYV